MTCRDATDFLADYLTGDLAPDVLATFEQHLALCPNCREFLAEYEMTIQVSRRACTEAETRAPALPDDLVRAIVTSLTDTAR